MELVTVTALPAQTTHDYRQDILRRQVNGYVCEFGVWRGDTLRILCESHPWVYGFDTFRGLPEEWILSDTNKRAVGCFSYDDFHRIDWPRNCALVPGRFADTLPRWVASHPGPVGLLHIDSDLYSSARDVLTMLNAQIFPGTVIAFDELCDFSNHYPLWEQGEWRALNEWLKNLNRACRPIARSCEYQVAIEVTQ